MQRISLFHLALKNLRRRPLRTLIMLLIVSVATCVILAATIFIAGMQTSIRVGAQRLGADVLVVPAQNESQARLALLAGEPATFTMDREVLAGVRSVEGVLRASPQLFLKPTPFSCCYNVETFLISFDPETDFAVAPWLRERLRRPLGRGEIIAGSGLPVQPGDSLPFFGTLFEVAGTLEPTGMKFFDSAVFMTMEAAYAMAEGSKTAAVQPLSLDRSRISAVLVQSDERSGPERVAIRIEHQIEGVRAIPADEVISAARRRLGGVLKSVMIMGGVVWALALLMMGFAFSVVAGERQREIGLLRAMGARRRYVFVLLVVEAVSLSVLGGIAGLGGGTVLLALLEGALVRSLNLPYLFPPAMVLAQIMAGALLLSALTGFIASALPAMRAGRMEPFEAIRKGE